MIDTKKKSIHIGFFLYNKIRNVVNTMSKKLFTNEEMLSLSKNRYVKRVSEKGITYTDEFKSLFIAEHSSGKLPIQIF